MSQPRHSQTERTVLPPIRNSISVSNRSSRRTSKADDVKLPPITDESPRASQTLVRKSPRESISARLSVSSEAEDRDISGKKRVSLWQPRDSTVKRHLTEKKNEIKKGELASLLSRGSNVNQVLKLLAKYDKIHAEQRKRKLHAKKKEQHTTLNTLYSEAAKAIEDESQQQQPRYSIQALSRKANMETESFEDYVKRKAAEAKLGSASGFKTKDSFVRQRASTTTPAATIPEKSSGGADETEAIDSKESTARSSMLRRASTAILFAQLGAANTGRRRSSLIHAIASSKRGSLVTCRRVSEGEVIPLDMISKARAHARWHWSVQRITAMLKATKVFRMQNDIVERTHSVIDEFTSAEHPGITASAIGFNMAKFKVTDKQSVLVLTREIIHTLSKETYNRSKADLNGLEKLVNGLPVFSKYDPGVRKALSRVIRFSHYGPGRFILKQGHPGQSFYIIASGVVEIRQLTQNNETSVMAHLHPGDSFGEVALLNDIKRNASVVTKTDVDLLWINREDFMAVLKEEAIRDIEEKETFIASIPYFGQLDRASINQLAATAKFREVPPNTQIFCEGDKPSNLFIVCEGTCRLLKCVEFAEIKAYSHGDKHSLAPYPLPPGTSAQYGFKVTRRLLKIGSASRGDFFGEEAAIANVGTAHQLVHLGNYCDSERFSKFQFSLVSNTKVRYVLLNRHTFTREIISQQHLLSQAGLRAKSMEQSLVNIPLIQEMYLNQIKWTKYKKDVVTEVKEGHENSRIPTLPRIV